MTLAQFSIAVGATPKWVQNAAASLGRRLPHTVDEARVLGLARVLNATAGLSLPRAYEAAARALAAPDDHRFLAAAADDGAVEVIVDVPRYLSTFLSRIAVARSRQTRTAGRPPKTAPDPIQAARDYGIDLSLVRSNLMRTPDERLRAASANAAFVESIRGRARPR